MTKVSDIISHHDSKADFGVEIELEGDYLFSTIQERNILAPGWTCVEEGSIRGGAELVSPPLAKKDLDKSVKRMYNTLKTSGVRYTFSDRTGIHLHMNVGHLTPLQLINFLCAYYIIEEALIDTCGENRIGNHFCLRAVDAEYIIPSLITSIEVNNIKHLRTDALRYSALNLTSLFKFATVEFRAIQTAEPFNEVIKPIVSVLNNLRKNCVNFSHPTKIVEEFSGLGRKELTQNLLGDSFSVIADVDSLEDKLVTGMRFAQDIAYIGAFNLKKDFDWGIRKKDKNYYRPQTLEDAVRTYTNTRAETFVHLDEVGTLDND